MTNTEASCMMSSLAISVIPGYISLIIPVYNHASALPGCLRSIFAQTYTAYEVIVVDDGSSDDLAEALAPWRDRITLITQKNQGSNPARNRGAQEARGEFLLFCDADVVLREDMLERMVHALREHPEASYAYATFRFGWKLFPGVPWSSHMLQKVNIAHTTSLLRACDFPGFDPTIRRFQDWDLWLTLLGQGKGGVMIPDLLFTVEIHGVSRIGSSWLPKLAYSFPWRYMPWIPRRIEKYRSARAIIEKKHHLPSISF